MFEEGKNVTEAISPGLQGHLEKRSPMRRLGAGGDQGNGVEKTKILHILGYHYAVCEGRLGIVLFPPYIPNLHTSSSFSFSSTFSPSSSSSSYRRTFMVKMKDVQCFFFSPSLDKEWKKCVFVIIYSRPHATYKLVGVPF